MEVDGKSSQEMENNGIMQQMELISNRADSANEIRMAIQSDIDSFNVLYSECAKYTQKVQHSKMQTMNSASALPENECKLIQEKEFHDGQLKAKSLSINNLICVYINKLNELINLINPVQAYIIDKSLVQWKRQQQLAGNGYKFTKDIDVIQTWCEKLCDLIWIARSQIKEADRFRVNLSHYFELPQSCQIINTLLNMTTQYLSSLVASTFVIIVQPPQVLKTNTRFLAEVTALTLCISLYQDISAPVTNNGYVKPLLVTHVPGWGGPSTSGQGMNSYPNTPQNYKFHENSLGNYSTTETSLYSEPDINITSFGSYPSDMDFSSSLNDISQVDGLFLFK